MAAADRIACQTCQHFFVTWDKNFPRGCRALGFKARELPSTLVLGSSGSECLYYLPRQLPPKSLPKRDA